MKKQVFNNRKLILSLILLIFVLIIGTSYALWQMTFRQTGINQVTTDCFKVEFTDKNPITLSDAYPLTDEDAKNLNPYEFTITNTCSEYARYEVNLEILAQTTLLHHSYIKAMYNDSNPKILTSYEKVEKTLDNITDSYNLEIGYLGKNEKKTINLRLWLSDDTPLSEDTMNKSFLSRVIVTTGYAKKLPGTLRNVTDTDTTGMWEYKSNITKLVIQNKLNKIAGAIKVSDESTTQDESIMSYIVPNEDGETYTAYLQGQDIIYLNSDSSYLFYNFVKLKVIDGIQYLDTSNTIKMNHMFWNCSSILNLDLSSFDTSKVTTINHMFADCSSLNSLNVNSFDTSNVISMVSMFSGCSNMTSLDLRGFDTSKVTIMDYMFNGCSNLNSLDVNSFDTSSVIFMTSMFRGCSNLTELDLSNFDTSQVINMNFMFYSCESLTNLDLSSFDTSKVHKMEYLFSSCTSLTDVIYGSNFVRKEGLLIGNMFSNCPANKPTHSSWDGIF